MLIETTKLNTSSVTSIDVVLKLRLVRTGASVSSLLRILTVISWVLEFVPSLAVIVAV